MDFIYFLAANSEAFDDAYGYHEHFFSGGAFGTATIIAIVVALICAAIFYFGFCTSYKTISMANIPVWTAFLIVAGVVTYLATDIVLIGHEDEDSAFYSQSFYADMEDHYQDIIDGAPETEIQEMEQVKNDIIENINQAEDVTFQFCITAAIISLIFYWVFSVVFKGFTAHGIGTPHIWPHKHK